MSQRSPASQGGSEKFGRKSRRELFLDEMETVVPWSPMESLVRPHDAKEGHRHSMATSAAHRSDVHMLPELLHGGERKVWGDGGYQGQTEAIQTVAPKAARRLRT